MPEVENNFKKPCIMKVNEQEKDKFCDDFQHIDPELEKKADDVIRRGGMAAKGVFDFVPKPDQNNPLLTQVGGDHYKKLGIYQPWEVFNTWMTPEELKGAMKKEVITYLAREADKGGLEDIKKAAHTLQIYLQLVEKQKS